MPENEQILRLRDVFESIDQLDWRYALYLPRSGDWTLESECAVLDPNQAEEGSDEPEFARAHGLRYALTVHQLQGIVRNARAQRSTLTAHELERAFSFYLRHDAFIEFGSQPQ